MPKKHFQVTRIKSSELKKLNSVIAPALNVPPGEVDKVSEEIRSFGIENIRAVRCGDEMVGGLQMYRWGHFFGGKSVPAAGIIYVGIAPEYRRTGAASALMAETVRELYSEGIPLSSLFPANIPLYRKSGYERAMERGVVEIKLADINTRNMKLEVVKHKGKSLKVLKEVYRKFASETNGNIDRSEIEWGRILKPWWRTAPSVYLIKRGRQVEGYVVLYLRQKDRKLNIDDCAFLSRDAAERILTFLADHSSVIETARYPGSNNDPLLQLIPDRAYELKKPDYCMLRIVSVPGALKARGYPPNVEAELHFDVADDIVKRNNGKFMLKVRNGKGTVKSGGEGSIRLDVRTLAQLYTGFLSPMELRIAGDLEASEDDIARMLPVFAGPRPWIRDDF